MARLMTHHGTIFAAACREDASEGCVAANVSFTLPGGCQYGRSFTMCVSDDAQCWDRPNAVARAMLRSYNRLTEHRLSVEAHYAELAYKIRDLLLPDGR